MNNKLNMLEYCVDYVDRSLRERANFVDTTKKNEIHFLKQ